MRINDLAVDLAADDQVRRPLAARIADDLRSQYPNWTDEHIHSEAKAQAIAQLQGKAATKPAVSTNAWRGKTVISHENSVCEK